MPTKRGILFELQTSVAPNADRAFNDIEQRVKKLQEKMQMHLSVTDRMERQRATAMGTAMFGPPSGNGSTSSTTAGMPSGAPSGWKGLSAQGRAAMQPDRWQQGIERMNAMQKAAERAEEQRAQRERADAQKLIDKFQKEADKQQASEERQRQRNLTTLSRQNERDVNQFLKEQDKADKTRQREAEQRRQQQSREQSQWDLILGGSNRTGTAGMRGPSRSDISDPMGMQQYQQQRHQQQQRERREQERANRDAEIALGRQREAYSRLGESIGATTDAVTRLGRGMAFLGLIGERDMGRLGDSLLAIQGTVDAVRGGIGSMRDIGGLMRNLREVRGIGGMGGIGRSMLGMAPAATTAARIVPSVATAAGTGAIGTGAAATGAAATAAPLGLIATATASVAAAIASAGLTIREAMQYGVGGGAHVGGVIDRVATAEAGMATRAAGWGLSVAGAVHNMSAPYGLTERQKELRTEKYLEQFSRGSVFSQSAFSNRQTEGMQRRAAEDRQRRLSVSESWARGNAIENQDAMTAMEARQRRFASHFQNQEVIDANARPHEQIAARQRAHNLRMQEFLANQGLLSDERKRINQQIATSPVGQARDDAIKQREQLQQRIVAMKEQELRLSREQRTIDVDGAKQRLQLLRDQYTVQTKTVQGLRGRKEDFEVKFAQMNPMQRAATIAAKRRLLDGDELSREERDLLRDADADSQQRLHVYERRMGAKLLQEQGAKDVQMGGAEQDDLANARNAMNDLRTANRDATDEEQVRLGAGVTIGSTVDNKITVDLTANSSFENKLKASYEEALQVFVEGQNERIKHWLEEANAAADTRVADAVRQIRQQGRVNAGR